MTRKALLISSNQTTFNLRHVIRCQRAKITKLRFTPDNITNVNTLIVHIDQLSTNTLTSVNNHVPYFFMIPFVNNNLVLSYTNDQYRSWDFEYPTELILNNLIVSLYNESGQLITMNNSNLILEILFE